MAQVPKNEGFSIAPSEGAAYHGTQYIDPGIKFTTPDFSKAAERFDKFQMQQDETRADAVMMELERRRIDNEKSMKSILGEDAMRADEQGRGLVQRYDEDLRKYGTELTKDLTINQQRLFNQKAEKTYLAQYGTAAQHVLEQNHKWQNDTYMAKQQLSIEAARTYYNKSEELIRLQGAIESDARKLADINGWSAEQTNVFIKNSTSAMYKNAVATALEGVEKDPRKAIEAAGILDANAKHMLGKDVLELRKVITGYENVLSVNDTMQKVMAGAYTDMASPATAALVVGADGKLASPEKARALYTSTLVDIIGANMVDGATGKAATNKDQVEKGILPENLGLGASRITIKQAKKAAEAAGEVFDAQRFVSDRGYNMKIGGAYFEHLASTFAGDFDKTMAAYFTDEETVKKAIESANRSGDPGSWLTHFMPADTVEKLANFKKSYEKAQRVDAMDDKGNKVNPLLTDQYSKYKGARLWATKEELFEKARAIDPRMQYDPTYAQSVEQAITRELGIKQDSYKQNQANWVSQAMDKLYASRGDFSAIPQEILSQLDINQHDALQKLAKKIADNDQSTNDKLYYRYLSDDSMLLALSEQEFKNLRCEIAGGKWEVLKQRYYSLKEKEAQHQDQRAREQALARQGTIVGDYSKLTASEVKTALKQTIAPDMWERLEKNPEDMQQVLGMAIEFVATRSQEEGKEVHGKERDIVAKLKGFSYNQLNIDTWYGGSKKKLFAALRAKDLPDSGPSDAKAVAKMLARGMLAHHLGEGNVKREPTQSEMDEAIGLLFWRKELPFSIPPNFINELSKPLVDEIIKANGGKEPPANVLLREYIKLRIDGKKLNHDEADYADVNGAVFDSDDYFNIFVK